MQIQEGEIFNGSHLQFSRAPERRGNKPFIKRKHIGAEAGVLAIHVCQHLARVELQHGSAFPTYPHGEVDPAVSLESWHGVPFSIFKGSYTAIIHRKDVYLSNHFPYLEFRYQYCLSVFNINAI